ncbi:hypothetical protein DFH07DRAFT_573681 [Mycena maculata]|uniref:Uncharacterized protein n=1 Tax=Mycena maculata TaxID=230809 RepID=A0AAD7ISI6_9AGAR|nr:hypothetical protein DFH07DRAFT_573681 [Mycena maculata]
MQQVPYLSTRLVILPLSSQPMSGKAPPRGPRALLGNRNPPTGPRSLTNGFINGRIKRPPSPDEDPPPPPPPPPEPIGFGIAGPSSRPAIAFSFTRVNSLPHPPLPRRPCRPHLYRMQDQAWPRSSLLSRKQVFQYSSRRARSIGKHRQQQNRVPRHHLRNRKPHPRPENRHLRHRSLHLRPHQNTRHPPNQFHHRAPRRRR